MDAAMVTRVMDLIPDRVTKVQSGTAFAGVSATSCVHPERVALLVEFLHWLSPIYPTTKDDQMRLGLFATAQRQMMQADPDEEGPDEAMETVEDEASLRIADACASSPL
ncbi:MAG: hypothetical protein QOD26_3918 [Betaproteobacteria bacterium]|jgi:hypothetical protein|nr:hypothetical protein [Betaproteobacteria bacterium]